ncbi:MerR family transcriptional regulator [Undibacterium pigrum]|uniref:MerR family copper efflux transcriptional regulator n=1 Tax=Undibacterium pigrum TaxID=401470 RepID=A0A318IWS1_9BURK|nr:MerR family transcriptional regulator [Undibacterium pigrum]PXX39765.1 MerR family copper efflux transcriptional regulator [Undibacterium pigrum]
MRISELEQLSGLSRDTIRYYERIGLLASPPRSDNGYRSYEAHTVDILKFIKMAQQIGFSLDQMREALPHLSQPPERCEELLTAMLEKRQEIIQRIADEKARLALLDKLMQKFLGEQSQTAYMDEKKCQLQQNADQDVSALCKLMHASKLC